MIDRAIIRLDAVVHSVHCHDIHLIYTLNLTGWIAAMPLEINLLPSAERLRELLSYDPATGVLTWAAKDGDAVWNGRFAGRRAGCVYRKPRYASRVIRIDTVLYAEHRVIWKIVTGRDPEQEVDHEDGDALNNKWLNLRDATRQEQMQNQRAHGPWGKGVTYDKRCGRYFSRIKQAGKTTYLGRYDTAREARAAYDFASEILFGAFAASRP